MDFSVIAILIGLLGGAILLRLFDIKRTEYTAKKLQDEYSAKEKTLEHVHKELTGVELEETKKTEAEIIDFWEKRRK